MKQTNGDESQEVGFSHQKRSKLNGKNDLRFAKVNEVSFEIPRILKFTVLPFRITSRAWVDPTFKNDLLRNPRAFLLEYSSLFPRDCQYLIHADTASLRHYTIPFLSSKDLVNASKKEILQILEKEVGDVKPFETWLPPIVLCEAVTDSNYLAQLIESPVSFLSKEGYAVTSDIRVIQNSPTLYSIPLKFNRTMEKDFESAFLSIRGSNSVVSTSQCCASGTCGG